MLSRLSWIAEKVTDTAKWVLGIHEIDLAAEQDSVIEPGSGLSVISGSLDELEPKISAEQFFAEVESSLRWPIDPMTEYVMKSCDVVESGPDEFTVKVTLDGKKLDNWGRGRGDGCDRVKSWKKVTIDRTVPRLTTEDYVVEASFGEWADKIEDQSVLARFNLAMLKEPTRIECWLVNKEGERVAGDGFANYMYGWYDPLIKGIKAEINAKVHCKIAPSPTDASVSSVVSDPMDDFIDYDTYFETMLDKTRQFFANLPDTELEDVSANEILAKTTVKDAEGNDIVQPKRITFNHESGEMTVTFLSSTSTASHSIYRVLHKSPLCLEAWNITEDGERRTPQNFVKTISREVNETIG